MHALTWQQALICVGALVAASAVAKLIGRLVASLVCRLLKSHTQVAIERLRGPIVIVLALALWQLALVFFDFPPDARTTMHDIGRVALVLSLVWSSLRIADLVVDRLATRHDLFGQHEASRALFPLGRRIAKILILAIAVVAVFGSLGYSVTGLIAGLGIGGIAVALAAQKTLENVIGAFALGIDQPLREGDFVKVDQTIGTVERIGLRSTRVRTLDRTMIAYPNGKLADSVIERFSARDRYRFYVRWRIGLATTSAQLRTVRDRIERLLVDREDRAPDPPSVHLTGTGDTWIELEAMAWFSTADYDGFQRIRDQLILDCMAIIASAGAGLNGAPAAAPAPPSAAPSSPDTRDARDVHDAPPPPPGNGARH